MKSIQSSIAVYSGGILLLVVLAFLIAVYNGNKSSIGLVVNRIQSLQEKNVEKYLMVNASEQVSKISERLSDSTLIARSIADFVTSQATSNPDGLSRNDLIAVLKKFLESNPGLRTIGIGWEPRRFAR